MSMRWINYAISLACAAYLAMDAWPRQSRRPAPPPPAAGAFPVADVAETPTAASPGRACLDQALAKLENAKWLQTTIWQRMHAGSFGYVSESKLALGPNHCARLTMTMLGDRGKPWMQEVISDGRALAEVERRDGAQDEVVAMLLPEPEAASQRQRVLLSKGCAGPQNILKSWRGKVVSWQMESATWHERAVIRVGGPLRSGGVRLEFGLRATRWQMILDAQTLWPHRIEWWGDADDEPGERLLLEMEFRDPVLDRALSTAECARLFSYHAK